MRVAFLALVAALVPTAPASTQTAPGVAEVVIRGVAVVDVVAGRLVPARDIVVRGTRVDRMAPTGGALPPAKTLVDGRGKVVMPGLIAAGVRLGAFSGPELQGLLAQGVTAVQDVGTAATRLSQWRDDLSSGRLYAPRITTPCAAAAPRSGAPIVTPGAPDAVHAEMARLVDRGRRPIDAVRAVTLDRARALCLDGLGAIAEGGPADLVVLAADPLTDIAGTRRIDAVIFRGEVMTRAHVNLLARGALPLPTPPR